MAKVLFFDPPTRMDVYLTTNVRVGAPNYPSLTLATLAGNLLNRHDVRIVDLDSVNNYYAYLFEEIESFRPE